MMSRRTWIDVLLSAGQVVIGVLLWWRGLSGWAVIFWVAAVFNAVILVGTAALRARRRLDT